MSKVIKGGCQVLKGQETEDPRRKRQQEMAEAVRGRVGAMAGMAVAALLCIFWPVQAMCLMLLAVVLFIVAMLSLNVPFIARRLHKRWLRYAHREPERAERLRVAADVTAGVIEQVLDLLPGGLADRLSLPDFSKPTDTHER